MEKLDYRLSVYLRETLDVDVKLKEWKPSRDLPFFLREAYSFYLMGLFNEKHLLMMAKDDGEQTPATIRKHISQIGNLWNGDIIYVHSRVSAHNRKRLIAAGISFIIPGNQMYLPPLGIDLREYFRQRKEVKEVFSPSTQLLLLCILRREMAENLNPTMFAGELGYSVMTMTRAFNELERFGLAAVEKRGRRQHLVINDRKEELWEKAKAYLRNPVIKRIFLYPEPGIKQYPIAGLTALSRFTNIAPPSVPVYAISETRWRSLRGGEKYRKVRVPTDEEYLEVEIWNYSPELFAQGTVVDRLSLYLALRGTQDERIEAALDEMMDDYPW